MFKTVFQGLILLFAYASFNAFPNKPDPNIKILSWNLLDFGKSKSDTVIEFIAQTVKDYDIVLIQEVVAKDPGGAQAVGRLGEALNKKGAKWEYRISDPTSGENSYKKERYAFLWKPSKVSLIGRPWLENKYTVEIDREPFYATFQAGDKTFTLVNFHAITKSMQPETEVKYFKFLPESYPSLNLIFCGDFNLPQSHTVFNPLKSMGYKPIFTNQKTSLRQNCIGDDCLASEFDNIFYNTGKILFLSSGVVHFYKSFPSLQEAKSISDHLPIFFVFQLK
jgi:endonuclease/exonuclease/phosphatase family metal-dependent hydrolase